VRRDRDARLGSRLRRTVTSRRVLRTAACGSVAASDYAGEYGDSGNSDSRSNILKALNIPNALVLDVLTRLA